MCAPLSSLIQFILLLHVWSPAFLFGINDSMGFHGIHGFHSTQNQSGLAKAKVSHIRKADGSLYPHETQIPTSIYVSNQIKLKQPSRSVKIKMQKIFLVVLQLTLKWQKLSKLQIFADLLDYTHMQVLGR